MVKPVCSVYLVKAPQALGEAPKSQLAAKAPARRAVEPELVMHAYVVTSELSGRNFIALNSTMLRLSSALLFTRRELFYRFYEPFVLLNFTL